MSLVNTAAAALLLLSTTSQASFSTPNINMQINTGRSATTLDAALYVATNEAILASYSKCKEIGLAPIEPEKIVGSYSLINQEENEGFYLVKIQSRFSCG